MVAGRPLFMIRGRDGKVRIFINSCLHRGALVCRQDSGNAGSFVCFYHGWSYDDCGKLVGVPDPSGYVEDFGKTGRALIEPRARRQLSRNVFRQFRDRTRRRLRTSSARRAS